MRWSRPARGGAVVVLGAALGSCFGTMHLDYRARPVAEGEGAEEREGARVVVEQAGIRAVAGPPAEFPYVVDGPGRPLERGRYQLFTRIRIENLRQDAVEVLWPEARIEPPEGEPLALVESAVARNDGAAGEPAPAPAERVEPGGAAARALIPESLHTIEVDEPLVALCDGCAYRIVVPVLIAGRRELVVLPFRLEAERHKVGGVRFLFWD